MPPMKTVHYRGVLVVFQLPEHWVEEYEPEGGGTFYDPDDASVTLRLNVITLASPRDTGAADASAVIDDCGVPIVGPAEHLQNGQTFAVGRMQSATERGTALELHPLLMVRIVPPRTVRIASFVTTVLANAKHSGVSSPKLDVIEGWVRACTISDAPPQKPASWWKRILRR